MSETRGRNISSPLNTGLPDFAGAALSEQRSADAALTANAVAGLAHAGVVSDSVSHDLGRLESGAIDGLVAATGFLHSDLAGARSGARRDIIDVTPRHVSHHAGHDDDGSDGTQTSASSAQQPPSIPILNAIGTHELGRGMALGELQTSIGGSHGSSGHGHAPPPIMAVGGQLWFGDDDLTNTGLDHIDGDAAGRDVADHPTDGTVFSNMGLDGADELYFGITRDGFLRDGHITNDTESGQASEIQETDMVFGSGGSADEVNALAVDPIDHIVFVGLWGQSDQYTGILEVTYNPTTGAMNNPYDASTGVVTNLNQMLVDDSSSGGPITNIIAMQYDMQNGDLYYVDQTNIYAGGTGTGTTWSQHNGIYVIGTSGSVGGGTAPTPMQLSLNSQFAAGDNNNYIEGLAINEAQGIIYFAVNDATTTTTKLYWMPIAGGTAMLMNLPGSVTLGFANDQGTGINPVAFDPNERQLYVSDNSDSQIVELTLSVDGKSFTGGNSDFLTIDHSNGGTGATGLYFDPLPTLAGIAGTSTEAVQGSGSMLTLLTAAPSITDPQDGSTNKEHMGFAQVVITNAQAGDELFVAGQESGSIDGGKITVSWNPTTHTLTFSGNETESEYQTLMDQVSFEDTGTDNSVGSHPTRTIDWIISDGTTVVDQTTADPNEETTTLTIDRAPTLGSDNYAVIESATSTGTNGTGGTGVFHNDSDKDGDSFTVTAVNGSGGSVGTLIPGTYGHLQLNADGSYTYQADMTGAIDGAALGSHPVDTFTYQASDGLGGVSTTTVSFTLDRAPTVVADAPATQAVESGSAVTGNVLTNDSDRDGDTLTVFQVNGVHGNVGASVSGTYGDITIQANGSYSYSADNTAAIDGAATGSHLTDTFSYQASDGLGGFTTTTITITLDRAPTVVADAPATQAVESGSAVTGNVLANDSDRDGDTLTVFQVNGVHGNVGASVSGTYGDITINADGSYSYSADNTAAIDGAPTGSHLTDTFSYQASDGFGGFTTTTITITLDRAPTVVNAGADVAEGGSADANAAGGVLAGDSDRDGDTLAVTSIGGSSIAVGQSIATTYGHITLNADGSYDYVADGTTAIDGAPTGSHPLDVVSFLVGDGFGGETMQTLSFTIDRAATATADSIATTENTPAQNGVGGNANLLANDVDKDGDAITIVAVNGSAANVGNQITTADGALVTVNADGSYTYDPNHQFDYLADPTSGASDTTATDSFTYTVDGGSTVTVTITVTGVDSNDVLIGTSGADTIHGGTGDDVFFDDDGQKSATNPHDTSAGHSGGADALSGDDGDDVFYMGANLSAAVQIDGGTGIDHVVLNGDYSAGVVFNATTMVNVEFLGLTAGHSYNLTMAAATVALGQTLTVQAGTLGTGDSLTFDGSADTAGGDFVITGGAGNDVLTGGYAKDTFNVGAGNDTVHGGGGNDHIVLGANLSAADSIDGGSGTDTLYLNGDYSAGVVFAAATLTNVEDISLAAGHDYNLTMNNATVAAGQTLTLHATALGAGDGVVFDASADLTGGNYVLESGAGDDVLTGGAGNDTFRPGTGNDTVHGGAGNDTINMGAALTAADSIDGGAGTDTLVLNGDYSAGVTFAAATLTNVEDIVLAAGHDYSLTMNAATVAAGDVLTLKASTLGAGDSLTFDGSADTAGGSFVLYGGNGTDTLSGGAGNDVIHGGNATNTLTGGAGADTIYGGTGTDQFVYAAVSDSTSTAFDKVHGFDADADTFKLTGDTVNAIDTAVTAGHLSAATFDANLAAAIGASQLAPHDAVLFTPDSGGLHGQTFLIVDVNGIAGYQAGQDFVIDITGAANLQNLATTDFVG